MKKLVESDLYGTHLTLIDRPETIARYNSCLERLGLKKTNLKKFHIDGIGWSPEVASEKEDRFYLSHGPANPLGIIISVNQRDKPIYMPTHSFDRVMMKAYFDQNSRSIANLTVETGIGLDLDQRLSWYETLDDIALVDTISVSSLTGDLGKAAAIQQQAILKFMSPEEDHWMDSRLRENIISSIKDHGNLIGKSLTIPEFEFNDFDDLYTCALGGVYIFRHKGTLALIVVEDPSQEKNASKKLRKKVVSVEDEDLIDRILDAEIAGVDLRWYRNNIKALETRLETLLVMTLSYLHPTMDVASMTKTQLRKELRSCSKEETSLYREIERLISHLKKGEDDLEYSREAELFLLHPVRTSTKYEENLVWKLICQIQNPLADVMRLYAVDKNLFTYTYKSWSSPMQNWVIQKIAGSYDSAQTYDS